MTHSEPSETTRDVNYRPLTGAADATRHDAPAGPARTTRDPGPGDTNPAATRRDDRPRLDNTDIAAAGWTRRDEPTGKDTTASPQLSARSIGALSTRFTVIGELAAQGAEADLLKIADTAGTPFVAKIFRKGITPDRSVWEAFDRLTSPHIVRIIETGRTDGRDYEVLEYVPGGSLRDLATANGPLHPQLLTQLIWQLADGINCLHAVGIVHRDLKPENILVRSSNPLNVAITDFGLSKTIEESMIFASSSRTLAYAAPESLSGQVSPARDWWSLGMIIRELATGRKPFAQMTEAAVVDHLATRPVDVGDIPDPRIQLACRGLLTRDPRRRWNFSQLRDWLGGGNPPVAHETAQPRGGRKPLPFHGETYVEKAPLAAAMVENWNEATERYFATMNTTAGPSEAWWTLREWMSQFDGPDDDVEARIRLVDGYLTSQLSPDVKLLYLLHWLDPSLAPHLLGKRVTVADMPALFAAAQDPNAPDHRVALAIGRALWDHQLLPVLAAFSGAEPDQGGAALAQLDTRWRELASEWQLLTAAPRSERADLQPALPELSDPDNPQAPVVLLALLALAADPTGMSPAFAQAAAQASAQVAAAPEWFTALTHQAQHGPVPQLIVVRAVPIAIAAAEAEARQRQLAELEQVERQNRWREREQHRQAGRWVAIAKAVGITAILGPLWLAGTWVVVQVHRLGDLSLFHDRPPALTDTGIFVTLAVVAWFIHAVVEVAVAVCQGREYLSRGIWAGLASVFRGFSTAFGVVARSIARTSYRFGGPGALIAVLALCVAPALLVASVSALGIIFFGGPLWVSLLVAGPVCHVIVALVRVVRWRRDHRYQEQEALQPL